MYKSELNMSHVAIRFLGNIRCCKVCIGSDLENHNTNLFKHDPISRPWKKVHFKSSISEGNESLGKQVMKMKIAPPQK